jgi:glycosyltransferase involved in cell wall biosynthesis/O-antigen ligase
MSTLTRQPILGSRLSAGAQAEVRPRVACAGFAPAPAEPLRPNLIVRWAFYLSVFLIPFSRLYLPGTGERLGVTRLVQALILCAVAFQPRVCLRFVPVALFWFAAYCGFRVVEGLCMAPEFANLWWPSTLEWLEFSLPWLWVMFNLLQFPRIPRAGFWALAFGCSLCAVLHIAGIGTGAVDNGVEGRSTVFGENANVVGTTYAIGLIAMVGLAMTKTLPTGKRLLLFAMMGLVAGAMAKTGSRTAALVLVMGLFVLFLHGNSHQSRAKRLGSLLLISLILVGVSLQIPTIVKRFERVKSSNLYQEEGRVRMMPVLVEMFLRSPIYGSGPDRYEIELTRRAMPYLLKVPRTIAAHNLVLLLLVESGVIGFLLFAPGVGLGLAAAWKTRQKPSGSLALALLLPLVVAGTVVSNPSHDLVFWFALAYALAGGGLTFLVPLGVRPARAQPEPFVRRRTVSSRIQTRGSQRPRPPSRRPRVALIASSLRLGGAEKQAVYAARALFEAGIDLRFFYLGAGGPYETALQRQGIPLRRIYRPNRPGLILARLIRALRKWKPDIVLASQFSDLLYAAPAGRFCRALTLGGVRSDGFQELKDHGALGRWMIGFSHGLVANSYRARQNLVSQGIDSGRIAVVPNGIDLEEFEERSCLDSGVPLPKGRVIAAAIGSLHPCKRFDLFLEALAIARRSEPALTGIVAGADRGQRAALEAKARALSLEPPDLIIAGECGNIPALLSHAELLVLTSQYEGFPNVILEAMAARLPVVTTPAGDAGRIVKDGQTGYVVNGKDTENMARFMVQLAQSAELRTTMGEAGRQRVENEYDYESLSGHLLDSFRMFAGKQRRASLVGMLQAQPRDRRPAPSRALQLEASNV